MVQANEPTGFDTPRDRPASNPRIEELRGRDDAMLPRGEVEEAVHFVNRGAIRRPRLTLRTYAVRFVNRARGGDDPLTKCTVGRHGSEHPTGTPGPTPSMPQLKQRRLSYDAESNPAATFDQSTTFHHASM